MAAEPDSFGGRVKKLRVSVKKWTQIQLKDKSGVAQSTIAEIESGKTSAEDVTAKTVAKLTKALGAAANYLLTGKGAQDAIRDQLLFFYDHLSPDKKDDLVRVANALYSKEHPEDRAAEPFKVGVPAKPAKPAQPVTAKHSH